MVTEKPMSNIWGLFYLFLPFKNITLMWIHISPAIRGEMQADRLQMNFIGHVKRRSLAGRERVFYQWQGRDRGPAAVKGPFICWETAACLCPESTDKQQHDYNHLSHTGLLTSQSRTSAPRGQRITCTTTKKKEKPQKVRQRGTSSQKQSHQTSRLLSSLLLFTHKSCCVESYGPVVEAHREKIRRDWTFIHTCRNTRAQTVCQSVLC